MKTLKSPEEIMINFSDDNECPDLTYSWTDVTSMILAAQRDALECAAENVKFDVDYLPSKDDVTYSIDKSSILNLLPKEL